MGLEYAEVVTSNNGMKTIIVQTYANNEVRIRWQDLPPVRKRLGDRADDRRRELESIAAVAATAEKRKQLGLEVYRDTSGNSYVGSEEQGFDSTGEYIRSNLDITREFQRVRREGVERERIKRTTVRPSLFGRNARHSLLEAGAVAERWSPKPSYSAFVTLTLPGSTKSAYAAVAKWSGFICNRLTQRLRRRFPQVCWFYVWELQKRGALHLHICITSQHRNEAMVAGRYLTDGWAKVLDDVGKQEGTCLFTHSRGDRCSAKQYWQFSVERVRKSVAAYVSKYASKSTTPYKRGKGFITVEQAYQPRRWWGMSSKLRRMVNESRSEIRFEGCTEQGMVNALAVFHGCAERHSPIRSVGYTFEVSHGHGNGARVVGSGHCNIYHFLRDGYNAALFDLCNVLGYVQYVLDGVTVGYRYGDPRERGFSSGLRTLELGTIVREKGKRRLSSRRVASFLVSRQQGHHAC